MKNTRLSDTSWAELHIAVPDDLEEIVANLVFEAGSHGLEVRDQQTFVKSTSSGKQVIGFFPQSEIAARQKAVESSLKSNPMTAHLDWSVIINLLQTEDWSTSWQARFKPIYPTENIVIYPSWEKVEPNPGQIAIEIDPKMAFGTGEHETTFLCVQAVEKLLKPDDKVLDIGTGSAVLAIIAEKLGAHSILAFDHDIDAIDAAQENLVINQAKKTTLVHAGLDTVRVNPPYDLVIGNLQSFIIKDYWASIDPWLTVDNIGIFSGILADEAEEMRRFFESHNLTVLDLKILNDWALFVVRRFTNSAT